MSVVSIRFLVSRTTNQLRCWWSYALSLFGIVRVRHLPTFISIEPANFCQLHCPECPVGNSSPHRHTPNRLIPMSLFERVLNQVQITAHTMQFYFQGEPLLNPLLPQMIALAHQTGLYTIVSTNAQAITQDMAQSLIQSGLNRIIVSIDGFSQESYEAYRVGGSLQKALNGLRFLHEAKRQYQSPIRIELQVLRLRSNQHEWSWIRKHYKDLGATHLTFKTAQLYDYQHGNPLMPTDLRYSRYRQLPNGTYVHKHSYISHLSPFRFRVSPCYRLWSGGVVTTNGEFLPCCYDKEHHHAFGNLTTHSLSELFHSKRADHLRRHVLRNTQALPEMCKNCNH